MLHRILGLSQFLFLQSTLEAFARLASCLVFSLCFAGPHADGKGKYWMIDGRDEEVPAGSVYRVTLHWGARLRVAWQREMSILSRGISTKELVGAEARKVNWVKVVMRKIEIM